MKTIKNLQRLKRIHDLIENEATGSPSELAGRLHISERLMYLLLEQLKDYEASIAYDRGRRTYYYLDDFKLEIQISVSVINKNEITRIFGGGPSRHSNILPFSGPRFEKIGGFDLFSEIKCS